ncbi:hypothetical protein OG217_05445 [Streptomyces sp. NBC_01023]|uniref:shikimate dehydrogenase family protein n=1 Tax=Streptomyces sp. NBC_01023 TaxID=2903724 RepID=UPI003868EDDA|nr:hypothetical protein OG217_05445 [Streptomyces sp. NBC_01023]
MTTQHQLITGSTRLFGVIGDPVEQVPAPSMMNSLFARLGIDAVLVPVHVRPARLAAVVRGLQSTENVDGLLITVPHKRAVWDWPTSPTAALSDGANAMRCARDDRWLADNFDGEGFVRGLHAAGHEPQGRHVWLVGAGGAGSAIAVSLLSVPNSRSAIGTSTGCTRLPNGSQHTSRDASTASQAPWPRTSR